MANYGWKDLVCSIDITVGGALTDVSSYIDEATWGKVKAMIEEWIPVTSTWPSAKDSGSRRFDGPIVIGGLFDDAASPSPDEMFFNEGAHLGGIRTVKFLWGGTRYWQVEAMIEDYEVTPASEKLTRFKLTLRPTGTPTFN